MGFGESASHAIFFIAAVVLAAGAVTIFQSSIHKVTGSVGDRSEALHEELTTDIRIINDPGDMPNNPLVLYVLNTGSRPLDPNETLVLVDGTAYTALTFDVLETSEDVWRTGQVLKITVTGLNLASGDHRVKVTGQSAVSDTLRFNIP